MGNVIYLDRAARAKQEAKAVATQLRRIKQRQSIGDPAVPANDNEDFPLLAALRRDKLHGFIELVMQYRRLVAIAEAEPLKGQDYGYDAGLYAAQESKRLKGVEEVEVAAVRNWEGGVKGGEIEYSGKLRRGKGAYALPATRKVNVKVDAYFENDDGKVPIPKTGKTPSLSLKFTDDLLLEKIDTRPILAYLRSMLGPLIDPFEDAVLGGQTLTKIGEKEGAKGVQAPAVGRALVLRGLSAVQGAMDDLALHPEAHSNIWELADVA
ncbi:hypothetical protein [Brucella pituitosa]|uniref:Uncharacterized protein n=1 Tax=Brucella pituitosa TaxID=571256 RepID=A0ABS3K0H0_9HYPH|nr:hypothetical protein [Brucella pituitosa]MBO1040423.1 hypothetical protein [Brucella pituitosa]PRA46661.1 hypothetical protein CQ062_23260 [Ochrobactrum sp. MYb68]